MPNSPTAQQVLESFSTWKYKRQQPQTTERLLTVIQKAISSGKPIRFVTYWGKGERKSAGVPEKQTLDFLRELFSKIEGVYAPGASLVILFTDTHARLNGYQKDDIQAYYESVGQMAAEYGFSTRYLSEFADFSEAELENKVSGVEIDPDFLKELVNASGKHYKKSQDYEYGAKLYWLQNQIERHALDREFSDYVFLTFNGSKFNGLFPTELPIFYMYSLGKGTSVKPWFI